MALMKSDLSPARQRLLQLMQKQNFCRIENLHIHNGEPVFDPPPMVLQYLRIGGDNEPNIHIHQKNYVLKQAQVELFQHLDELWDGVVDEIEVRHGLPQHLRIKRAVS